MRFAHFRSRNDLHHTAFCHRITSSSFRIVRFPPSITGSQQFHFFCITESQSLEVLRPSLKYKRNPILTSSHSNVCIQNEPSLRKKFNLPSQLVPIMLGPVDSDKRYIYQICMHCIKSNKQTFIWPIYYSVLTPSLPPSLISP